MVEYNDKEQGNMKKEVVPKYKKPIIQNQVSTGRNYTIPLRLTSQNLVEALIYSEILAEPRCKRRGRCR